MKPAAKAQRIRAAADRMQAEIDAKRVPCAQNMTARRSRMEASRFADADRLAALQRCMRGIADALEDGHLEPDGPIARSATKAGLERLVTWGRSGALPDADGWNAEHRAKLAKAGIDSDGKLRACWEWVRHHYDATPERTPEQRLRELERGLIGFKIPGFFPTPAPLADRVVMNPPFERYQDRDHVLHALSLLKPGGRLVAITGAGAWQSRGSDKFEDDLANACESYWTEPLDEGAFSGPNTFRQTSVRAVLLIAEVR